MLFLNMNATDSILQNASYSDLYQSYGYFPVSQFFIPIYDGFSLETIHIIERTSWWMHILGILFFLNRGHPTSRKDLSASSTLIPIVFSGSSPSLSIVSIIKSNDLIVVLAGITGYSPATDVLMIMRVP